jgi:diaminopimelate epimerase
VWERGAGETSACGTAACAALVTASRTGVTGRSAVVELPGGPVGVLWRDDNHILLTGPAQTVYHGTVSMEPLLRGLMEKLAAEADEHEH